VSARLAVLALCAGCGAESLFGQGGYDPSKAPEALVHATAPGAAHVAAFDIDGSKITEADLPADFVLSLGAAHDFTNLRLSAHAGAKNLRTLVVSAPRGKMPTDAGALDERSTATALAIEKRLADDGMRFGETPANAMKGLLLQAAQADPDLDALRAKVAALVGAGAAIPDTGFALAPADTEYDMLLERAAQKLHVVLSCDPSFVRVMFTVDVSGAAKDGTGARQLIRQAPKDGHVYIGITVDDSSPVPDAAGALRPRITPNDPQTVMFDDGTSGDEKAGDGVFTRVFTLPRGMRVKYKYTDGSSGDGFTRTEEWPGNARILEIDDLVSRYPDNRPDCLVVRRDSFGDESSNKNFVNLNPGLRGEGGALSWDKDLGGGTTPLKLEDPRTQAPLTPTGIPEARENGVCEVCPAPLTVDPDDHTPPGIVQAAFRSVSEVRVTFTEAMDFATANDPGNYLILDSGQRALGIAGVAAAGNLVTLEVAAPDFRETYTLYARGLTDASMAKNPLPDRASVVIGPDTTPPRLSSARTAAVKDLDPSATTDDPTAGEVVVLSFDEALDSGTAENTANYQIVDGDGNPLAVLAAYLREQSQVWLVTARQVKLRPYKVSASGVRDLAGNYMQATDPLTVAGFALFRMTFGVVPGFALTSRDGSTRGIPRGEDLYLTGTVLAVARDLQGNNISLGGRTDVTGVPEFQLTPSSDRYHGQPVYRMSLLAPPGVYAWKPAHGVAGEYLHPPTTLEKGEKDLATTNDATGVAVDPETLRARNGVDYTGAILSADGTDPPGPHVLFKRENPDEVCEINTSDATCPSVVIGTWRDLDDWIVQGRTQDYDDGVLSLDPIRDLPDTEPPRLLDIGVRDSESLVLTFDEQVVGSPSDITLSAQDDSGGALTMMIYQVGFPAPHQIAVETGSMAVSGNYTLTYNGLADVIGNRQSDARQAGFVAPASYTPRTPWNDNSPPAIQSVTPVSPTEVDIGFSKPVAPASADASHFQIRARAGGAGPQVASATVQSGGRRVVLVTSPQQVAAPYTLTAQNIADTQTPPHVLTMQSVDWNGFGDTTPPDIAAAYAISATEVLVKFDKALDALSAGNPSSYQISGISVVAAEFSGADAELMAAFNPSATTYVRDTVVLRTQTMAPGASYMLMAPGVHDLSGNAAVAERNFMGVAGPVTVDVEISYLIGQSTVAGQVPPRALTPQRLAQEREGVFLRGATVSSDGLTVGTNDPVTMQLDGFPPDGTPLDGVEPQLTANGTANTYAIRIRDVPLGTSIEWKAFASYTVAWKQAHPGDAAAQFADPAPGPSAYQDGQEFPGNEDGARILGQPDGSGVVHLHVLFGDEVTYKKLTNHPAFVWVVGDWTWRP
jgi:hypothetical protein